jgi:TIR domain
VSSLAYTETEWRAIEPVFEASEVQGKTHPERRDVFLCHAHPDRAGAAKELDERLVARDVSVWFSERDIALGTVLISEIDKGLRMSRIGIVLVTQAFLATLDTEGLAAKELAALLNTNRVIPVAHGTTFEQIVEVSPLLGSRTGLISDGSLDDIAARIADAVKL